MKALLISKGDPRVASDTCSGFSKQELSSAMPERESVCIYVP